MTNLGKEKIIDVDYLHRTYPNTFKYQTAEITLYRAGGDFIKSSLNTDQHKGVIIVSSNRRTGVSTLISDMLQYTFEGNGEGVTIHTLANGHSDLHTNIHHATNIQKLLPHTRVNIVRNILELRGPDYYIDILVADDILKHRTLVDIATINMPFIASTTPDIFMKVCKGFNNPNIMVITL